jgi:chemotaxis response regulator CheB
MTNRDILAIGTSPGGVEALRFLAKELPRDLSASVLVVIHLPRQFRSTLDAILGQAGPLPAAFAKDGERIDRSRIYIGPPDRHLLLDGDRLVLGNGPRENHARPAIDPPLGDGASFGRRHLRRSAWTVKPTSVLEFLQAYVSSASRVSEIRHLSPIGSNSQCTRPW